MEKTPPLVDQHGDRHFGLWGVLLAESRPSPTNGLQLFLDQVTNCSSTPDATTNTLDGCVRELRQRVPHNLHTHYGLTSNPNSLADFSPCLVVPLFGDVVCIGRLPTSDVVLSGNPCVSGLHCSFAVAVAQPHTHRWSSGHADEVPPSVGGARSDEEVARSVRHEPSTFDGCVPNSAHDEIRNGDGDEHDDDVELRITMCDHSSNGCYVNGKMLGKNHAHNDLRSGDVVELVNAGPRHTTGCNLKFIFLLVEDFIRQAVGSSVAHEGTTPLPTSSLSPPKTVVEDVNKRRRDLKRQVMLLRAQWEATAQVQRMYGHDVEDFYSLDKSPSGVLGEGAFGSVHRGALNTAHAKASTDALLPLMQHAARVGSMWSEEEEHTCRQAFIDARVNEPPASAVELLAEHASLAKRTTGKPSSSSLRGQQDVEVDVVDASTAFIFAIKMIQRQRVLRDWLLEDADQAEVELKPETKCIPSATREEVRVLKDLIQLETQPPEYANRLERELHDQQREEVLVMLGAESQGSTTQPSQDGRRVALLSQLEACGPGDARLSQREMAQQRELMRQRLLASLHPTLRRAYERELQGQRRQQSELNILRTVSHPHITRLVEVFDHGNTLSLVMEQATGGEAWDLLQPRATRRSAAHPTPTTSSSSSTSVNHHSNMADNHGLSCGGPLPEFLVKIIILQVLEGVRYLHSRGIIHRDLKLENILLQRPCHIQQVCALQLQLLIMRLEAVEKECEGWSTTTNNNSPTLPKEAVGVRSNPLSLIHTIHIQRALWPVVKITDFGLSHVLQTTGQQQQRQRQGATIKGDAGVEDEELHRIYARHEMKTSCGTPVYAAPEVTDLRRRPNRAGYSAAVDLYSVGVMAFALLTGRVPFPVRQHAATNGERARVEVDYTAKVCFDRCRRRRGGAEAATARLTKPPAPSPSPLLPLLGVVAGIHVASTPTSPASDADAHALASPAPTAWTADMKDLAAAVQRAEKNPHMSRFPDTIRLTLRVLKAYARQCVEHQREVDIEHLFWLSMQSHDRGVNTSTADVFPLAPVSPLGQEFILSLLHIDPMKRMNAWDALQHPWLRDAVQSL